MIKFSDSGVVMSYTAGVSMRPLIWQGHHYVVVVPVDDPQISDMLMFEQRRAQGTVNVLHRLIRIEGDIYITRGDNCVKTERVRRADILGRATDIYRVGPHHWYHAINAEHVNIADPAYRRYVRWLNISWPMRYLYYQTRGFATKIRPLRALYRKLKKSLSR